MVGAAVVGKKPVVLVDYFDGSRVALELQVSGMEALLFRVLILTLDLAGLQESDTPKSQTLCNSVASHE